MSARYRYVIEFYKKAISFLFCQAIQEVYGMYVPHFKTVAVLFNNIEGFFGLKHIHAKLESQLVSFKLFFFFLWRILFYYR